MDTLWSYCICFIALLSLLSRTKGEEVPGSGYGTCKTCFDGYTGDQCTQALCYGSSGCLNGGTCASPDNCTCSENYVGNRCEQALCFGSATCSNGGTCVSPDTCHCTSGYTGPKCEDIYVSTTAAGSGGRKSSEPTTVVAVLLVVSLQVFFKNLDI